MKKFILCILVLCTAFATLAAESDITLTVKASQKGAVVRVNSRTVGEAPITLTDLKPGFYIITVEKSGYYPWTSELALNSGDDVSLYAELDPITGTVVLNGAPDDVLVFIDNEQYKEPESTSGNGLFDLIEDLMYLDKVALKVPEGRHTITLQKFGYEDRKYSVVVIRHTVQQLDVSMKLADFEVSGFPTRLLRFNPANPGGLGSVTIPYRVTAPGDVTIEIFNPYGDLLATRFAGPFTTWQQSFTWKGETDMMVPYMPDGMYTLRFSFTGYANPDYDETFFVQEIPVEIDSSLTYQVASLGDSGLSAGSVPLALMSPAHTVQLNIGLDIVCGTDGDGVLTLPVPLGFEYNISDWTSFALYDQMIPNTEDEGLEANVLTISAKRMFVQDTVNAGCVLRYQWLNNDVGYRLYDRSNGIAAEFMAGVQTYTGFYAGASAGVLYGDRVCRTKTGAAVNLQRGIIALDGFGTLYSKVSDGFVLNDGIEAGATLHVVAGSSSVILNGGTDFVWRPEESLQVIPRFSATIMH